MRELRYLIIALIAITAVACFKDEKQGTLMRIAVYSQETADSDIVPATDLESYAFWVKKGSKWKVSSWEDAKTPIAMILCIIVASVAIFVLCTIIELLRIQIFKLLKVSKLTEFIARRINDFYLRVLK